MAKEYTLQSKAFDDDQIPPALSVAIVSLVELCDLAMPDPIKMRALIEEAGFDKGPNERAEEAAAQLALDIRLVKGEVSNLRHEFYGKFRNDAPVLLLLSEGDTKEGPVVFCSTIFMGATQADAVKAAAHVTKAQPVTGQSIINSKNQVIRRVYWDTKGASGMASLVVSGPDHVDVIEWPRAFIAFNKAGKRK